MKSQAMDCIAFLDPHLRVVLITQAGNRAAGPGPERDVAVSLARACPHAALPRLGPPKVVVGRGIHSHVAIHPSIHPSIHLKPLLWMGVW